MSTRSIAPRVVGTLMVAAILSTTPILGSAPAPSQRQARFEIRFMQNMIDHHAMAIMMAQVCIQKAVHGGELQQMCQSIIASQSSEIQKMQGWLNAWYGTSYTPNPSNAGMQKLDRLTGAEFEIEFMQEMAEHHAEAIGEATDCLLRAYHKELRDLCENIIKAQATEVNLMRTWLCQWYSECGAV